MKPIKESCITKRYAYQRNLNLYIIGMDKGGRTR